MCCYSMFFFFKQKTAYEMRISDWSSDVCSSDLGSRQLSGDRRIDRRRLAVAAELRIGQAVARLAVVGIDDVTARAARMAIVAGLVVGSHEPHIGVVEARVVKVRSEAHTSDLQAIMRISYAVLCLKKKHTRNI